MSNLPDQTLIRSAARKLAISGAQEISVITELRSQGHDPELVRMAIEQAQLRLKAANAWGRVDQVARNGFSLGMVSSKPATLLSPNFTPT